MAKYLFQWSYTPEAWATLMKTHENRAEVVRAVVERLGGKVECVYLTFGEYDGATIMEFPDHISAAAFSVATSAGGALKAAKTTPLMTFQEGIEAMKKAVGSEYRPPGS